MHRCVGLELICNMDFFALATLNMWSQPNKSPEHSLWFRVQHIHSLTRHANLRIEEETCWWRVIGQSSNLPGHQGNPGHWPFGSYTNIHAKTAANWVEHAQLLWCFSIHSQVRKSTVEPLSTISQDASRCSGLLRASCLEHVVRTELINITFPLIQGSAHTNMGISPH